MKTKLLLLIVLVGSCFGCGSDFFAKLIADHPEIVTESIKKNPKAYMEALSYAQQQYMQKKQEERAKNELAKREEEFKNPKKPSTPSNRVYFGKKNAPITIVEYSDFQCGYCARAMETMKQVLKNYPDKVRVLYKHFAIKGSTSMLAGKYYEAIGRQSAKKAQAFHDGIFEKQRELHSEGEAFLKKMVQSVKVDKVQLEKDLKQVGDVVKADQKEAIKFGFSGTPGFLVGGITVPGAVPYSHFKSILDRLLNKKSQGQDKATK